MWREMLRASCASALLFIGTTVMAADLDYPPDAVYEENGGDRHKSDYRDDGGRYQPAHDRNGVDHAYRKLRKHGFYEIVLERGSVPYSFSACKRGKRYHIHIDYNGELEELNSLGACQQFADEYDSGPRYSGGPDEQWRRSIYRRARHYY